MSKYQFTFIRFEFNPRHLLIGLHWKRQQACLKHYNDWRGEVVIPSGLHFYVCLIPCFPLHICLLKKEQKNEEHSVHFEAAQTHRDVGAPL